VPVPAVGRASSRTTGVAKAWLTGRRGDAVMMVIGASQRVRRLRSAWYAPARVIWISEGLIVE
jgi:hypothetical protein